MLDLSHTGHKKDLARLHMDERLIPYFHLDITLQTFAHAMDAYVTARQGGDTIFVVRTEEGKGKEAPEAIVFLISFFCFRNGRHFVSRNSKIEATCTGH